ncbi:hypothetical protein, partial [Aeromonas veronii]|uniref:hypothetical protein n=1 Tax=Aeromonas veronii TaxID=654 RepID=UPI003F7AD512
LQHLERLRHNMHMAARSTDEGGIEGSKATHKRIKAHYNALGQQIPVPPEIREEDLKPQSEQGPGLLGKIGLRPMVETPLGVAERLNAKFAKAFKVGQTRAVALVVKAPLTPHQLGFGPFAGLAHILPQSVNFCGG